jgi:hypothetical protein
MHVRSAYDRHWKSVELSEGTREVRTVTDEVVSMTGDSCETRARNCVDLSSKERRGIGVNISKKQSPKLRRQLPR